MYTSPFKFTRLNEFHFSPGLIISLWEISIFSASWDFRQISVYLMGGELTIWDLQDAETPFGKSVIVTLEFEPYNPLLVPLLYSDIYVNIIAR